ncbi:hypothetical protein [Sphingobacterium chuzhouense]|uniref:TonB-linked outer membrane protein, SusC/RagA family n=1 Tax=Sphingobacterium chuzhouense TaxID=1742264 RepID=A0ABR7XT91_9SPHI|nr:hypothetical protein [Sphingobacterium chuzhouense]MBD1422399.1 hypothetical protein [Sphingobacterium chuzhouense]
MKNISYLVSLFFLLLFGIGFSFSVNAQEIKGIVHELESSQRLREVTVKNLRTNETTETDTEGNFTISGKINDLLTFNQPGYEVDTAFIYQEGVQRIYLVRDSKSIVIDEIVISRLTDSRLAAEIEKAKNEGQVTEASQTRGGLRLSLSRLFGRQSKMARKNLDLLLEEQNNRKVDRLFSEQAIRAVIPLTVTEMALFREQFRPSLEFIETASPEDLRVYILDSYSKFKSKK